MPPFVTATDLPSDDSWSSDSWPSYTPPKRLSIEEERAALIAQADTAEGLQLLVSVLMGVALFGVMTLGYILAVMP